MQQEMKSMVTGFVWFLLASMIPAVVHATGTGTEAGSLDNPGNVVKVYRSPSCGCCGAWMAHMKKNGFEIVDKPMAELADLKRRYQIPAQLRSCHTALVAGYIIEGHVPAGDIQRLLRERPKVAGVAVPGMPVGSPGMEANGRRDSYQVFTFSTNGEIEVFQAHDADAK